MSHAALPGAEVESIDGVNVGRGAKTDSNGAYRLDSLIAGSMTMRASIDGYNAQTIGISLSDDQALNFDLSTPQAARYRFFGVVRDGVGTPVAGATVHSGNGACDFSARTDAAGHYDGTSNCASVVLGVDPPAGYEGITPYFQNATGAGERNFTTKRIVGVSLSAPSQIPRSDGTMFFSVSVSVRFDDGTTRSLGSEDLVTLQSSDANIVRTRGADGHDLSIEGVATGTASLTATYWGVVSDAATVTVK